MIETFYSPSEPRKSRSLAMNLVEKLTIDVREGKLRPGEKLPTEAAIMQSFGVSRTVVREAISKLQASALVETRHGIGTFVLPQDVSPAFKVSPNQLGTLREVIALLEFRISIETEAAALAALRREDINLQKMQLAMTEFATAISEGRDAIHADFLFHQEIAQATQNKHFQELMQSLGTEAIPRGRLENAMPVEPNIAMFPATVEKPLLVSLKLLVGITFITGASLVPVMAKPCILVITAPVLAVYLYSKL